MEFNNGFLVFQFAKSSVYSDGESEWSKKLCREPPFESAQLNGPKKSLEWTHLLSSSLPPMKGRLVSKGCVDSRPKYQNPAPSFLHVYLPKDELVHLKMEKVEQFYLPESTGLVMTPYIFRSNKHRLFGERFTHTHTHKTPWSVKFNLNAWTCWKRFHTWIPTISGSILDCGRVHEWRLCVMNLGKAWRLNRSIQEREARIIGATTFPHAKTSELEPGMPKNGFSKFGSSSVWGHAMLMWTILCLWHTIFSEVYSYHTYLDLFGSIFGWKFTKLLRLDPWPTRVAPQSLAAAKKHRLSKIQQFHKSAEFQKTMHCIYIYIHMILYITLLFYIILQIKLYCYSAGSYT